MKKYYVSYTHKFASELRYGYIYHSCEKLTANEIDKIKDRIIKNYSITIRDVQIVNIIKLDDAN